MKKKAPTMKAQGDILFVRVDTIPSGAKQLKGVKGRHLLAEGEATGHAHTISSRGVTRFDEGGVTYLTVEELTEVQHQEHGAVALEPGTWLVKRQREMSVVDLMPKQVSD